MIRIGILHSLTGTMAISEAPLVQIIKMAIDEINETGGVLGEQVETVIADGASDPLEFSRKARELRQSGIPTIFGCWTSASRKAVKDVIEGSSTQLWYPIQYEGIEQSPNIYYTGSTLNQQIEPAVQWCIEHLGKSFFLVGSDYVFPRTANRLIRSIVLQAGGKIVEDIYHPLGDKKFSSTIDLIKQHKPDVVFNTLNGDSNLFFYKQLHQKGMDAEEFPVMAVSIGETEAESITEEINGHYTCWSYFQTVNTAENRAFIEKVQNNINRCAVTSDPMATAYAQLHLWGKAANAAGSIRREDIHRALKKLWIDSPLGQFQIIENNHTPKLALIGKANANGQFEIVWSSKDQIEPLPWLGMEKLQLPASRLIKEVMGELPRFIDLSSQLEHEVDKRKKAELAIQKERDIAQSYLNTASVMMVAINKDKEVILANKKTCEVLGYPEENILGKN
ncbi:urea transport system substrate-binding protein [Mariprofundus ferrinatatus]|uniref:Urea transport system substrate-binding protein n=1 Tax=Mariprofundus ferrinatatus TaxID=1921087 RepID=A0A2K8L698_9PROT|nr:transporter substrate-binding protein [Mariprofundus ferrinatatus]ATX82632.1 urea transport system substrate-binding protein [Mariprofundus ferrinatatus]